MRSSSGSSSTSSMRSGRGGGASCCSRTVMPVGARGKISRMVVPRPSSLSISSSPPCRCTMPNTIGSPEPGAALALGGEERFEAAAARGLAHADAVVLHLDDHLLVARIRARAQRDDAAVGQRVDGVQQQVGQRVAHLVLGAEDLRQIRREVALDAAPRRRVPAACCSSARA